jgi:hypothetical protein
MCVNYEVTMFKYGVTDVFMSDLTQLILDRKNLTQARKVLSKNHNIESLSLKKIYVLASSISSSIMGDELSVVCPEMYEERISMKSAAVTSFKKRSKAVVNGYDYLEDILEEIESAIFDVEDLSM